MKAVDSVYASAGRGLEGDRYFKKIGTYSQKGGPDRNVTLIEMESLEALKKEYGVELLPGECRRNIVTSGVALNDLVNREFMVGEVKLRGIRLCEPCVHLERLTNKRVLQGLVHRGGLRAEVLSDGWIHVQDTIHINE
jgi:MOSC domain-containing protein YiiM